MCALVFFLTGIKDADVFEHGPTHCPLFENYVVSEIMKRETHSKADSELFYFRTSNGVEIDLIIDRKTSREFIENQTSETYRSEMSRAIEQIKKENEKGFLLHRGKGGAFRPGDQNLELQR